MQRTLPFALLASAGLLLGGCSLAGTLAATAISAVTSGGGAGAPATEASPGEALKQALAGIDDRLSPACSSQLRHLEATGHRQPTTSGGGRNRPGPHAPQGAWAGFQPAGVAAPRPQTPAGLSRNESCGLRPTCLPGATAPVMMMVCANGDQAADRRDSL